MRIKSWKGRGVSDADFTLTPTRLSSNTLQLLLSNTDENITKKVQNNTSGPVHSSDYSSGGLIWRSSPPFESWRSSSNQVWYKCSRDQLGVSHQLCLLPRKPTWCCLLQFSPSLALEQVPDKIRWWNKGLYYFAQLYWSQKEVIHQWKYVHNQHWAAPADQDQGRGWNSTPSWGRNSSMVSFGRKYSRKRSNRFS